MRPRYSTLPLRATRAEQILVEVLEKVAKVLGLGCGRYEARACLGEARVADLF
jgi:hypothetical protein